MDATATFAENARTVMVFASDHLRQSDLKSLAQASGCVVIEPAFSQPSDYILIDLCSETEVPQDSLSEIVEYLDRYHSVALVWTDMDRLEDAYAALPSSQTHFLVDTNDVQAMPILAGTYGREAMNRLRDKDREVEFGSLHRISDELAEFARTLAKLADTDLKSGVSDKPISFRSAPVGGFQPFAGAPGPTRPAVDAKALRDIIKLRRLRDRFFDRDLFADPAWDILLDLKAAMLEGQRVSVSSLCTAAAVPPTTALRWIAAMTESGMLVRAQDPDDARRVFIELSEETAAKIDDYFAAADAGAAKAI